MCGPNYELMAVLDEMEEHIEEQLLNLLKDWKNYASLTGETDKTIGAWQELFCSYVKEQLADFEKQGKLKNLVRPQ